jgi:hypothetical protein
MIAEARPCVVDLWLLALSTEEPASRLHEWSVFRGSGPCSGEMNVSKRTLPGRRQLRCRQPQRKITQKN